MVFFERLFFPSLAFDSYIEGDQKKMARVGMYMYYKLKQEVDNSVYFYWPPSKNSGLPVSRAIAPSDTKTQITQVHKELVGEHSCIPSAGAGPPIGEVVKGGFVIPGGELPRVPLGPPGQDRGSKDNDDPIPNFLLPDHNPSHHAHLIQSHLHGPGTVGKNRSPHMFR